MHVDIGPVLLEMMTKIPSAKMPATPSFCFSFICSLETMVIGSAMMMASEKMLTEESLLVSIPGAIDEAALTENRDPVVDLGRLGVALICDRLSTRACGRLWLTYNSGRATNACRTDNIGTRCRRR